MEEKNINAGVSLARGTRRDPPYGIETCPVR